MKLDKELKTLHSSRGDFLLSQKLNPNPDYILFPNRSTKKEYLSIGFLDKYLKFLELVITNQRIISVTFPTYTELEANTIGKEQLKFYFHELIYAKEPVLEEQILKKLEAQNIYFPAIVKADEFSPRGFVNQHLRISEKLQKLFKNTKKTTPVEFKKYSDLIAQISLAEDIGIPLSIMEFAKLTSLPFALHHVEQEAIKEIESAEVNLRNGVIAFLMEKLNHGAQKELQKIAELGNRVIYPETPIAWQIISNSSTLEDFLPVALQLREEYKKFREATINVEEELFNDETTLNKKNKLVKELNLMATEIWKGQENTTQKFSQDFSSLLDLTLNQATNLSLSSLPKLLEFVLGKPTEILLSKLNQRKIRVLMNSKKQFMSSRKWTNKLSSIFSLPEDEIKESILDFHKITKR